MLREMEQEMAEFIAEGTRSVENAKNRLLRIPIEEVAFTSETEGTSSPQMLGRLGQRILVQQSLQPPSRERDNQLQEAVGLLGRATEANRAYWQDILEARRLMLETPRTVIEGVLFAGDSGISGGRELGGEIRSGLRHHLQDMHALVMRQSGHVGERDYSVIFQGHSKQLGALRVEAQTMKRNASNLQNGFEQYLDRLGAFLESYQKSKVEGLFANDQSLHLANLQRLERKLRLGKRLLPRIVQVSQKMEQIGEGYDALIEDEIDFLASGKKVTRNRLRKVQKVYNSIQVLHMDEHFFKEVDSLFSGDLPVYP